MLPAHSLGLSACHARAPWPSEGPSPSLPLSLWGCHVKMQLLGVACIGSLPSSLEKSTLSMEEAPLAMKVPCSAQPATSLKGSNCSLVAKLLLSPQQCLQVGLNETLGEQPLRLAQAPRVPETPLVQLSPVFTVATLHSLPVPHLPSRSVQALPPPNHTVPTTHTDFAAKLNLLSPPLSQGLFHPEASWAWLLKGSTQPRETREPF